MKDNHFNLKTAAIMATLILSTGAVTGAQETQPSTMKRVHDPVMATAEILTSLHGKSVSDMRLYASRGGALQQIPFQINERLPDGAYILNLGEGKKDQMRKLMKRVLRMPPQQRARFIRNLKRWRQLSPRVRARLRKLYRNRVAPQTR